MNKKKVVGIIVCSWMVLSLHPGFLYGQARNDDDSRFSLPDLAVTEIPRDPRQKAANRRLKREVKYIVGKDNKWFTADDQVYRYYPVQYDKEGRMIKKSCFDPGADGRAFTKDDVLVNYQVFQYGSDDRVEKEITYDGKKKKLYTVVPTYVRSGEKIKAIRYDPQGKEIGLMTYEYYPDGTVRTDVEYRNGQVEKYHHFTHDHSKQYGRVVEFLASKNGSGKDGIWFNEDDEVSSAKECFYNPDNSKASEKKYIESGPDKKWFTKDDVLQYYQVFEYETVGVHR